MRSRLVMPDVALCERALERLEELDAALEKVQPGSPVDDRIDPCGLGELCQAASESLGSDLHARVLVAVEQSAAPVRLDSERAVRCLRRLMRAMFTCGAGAVLLHAHLDEGEAVFAILDDQQLFNASRPEGARDYDPACREIEALGGSSTPIGSAQEQQGLVVRLPVSTARSSAATPAWAAGPGAGSGTTGASS